MAKITNPTAAERQAEINAAVRQRAGGCCEVCGLPNGTTICRNPDCLDEYLIFDLDLMGYLDMDGDPVRLSELPGWYADSKEIAVVLTVGHRNHDPSDNRPENLACWCQLHHLRHDAPHHAKNAARTRGRKRREAKVAQGQMELDLR